MQHPFSRGKNSSLSSKVNTFQIISNNNEHSYAKQKSYQLRKDSDVMKQANELRNLKPYSQNREFVELMFSGQPLSVEKCLEKYSFYSENMENLSRKKLKIVKCSKGVMYVGEVFNDKCHGRGIVVFEDGRLYEGKLENNVRQGEGLYVQADGSWYFGEFSNDKKDGSGIEIHQSHKYKGSYINGLKHGVGLMVTDHIVYNGQWRLGAIHGYGFAETPQSKYEGTFQKFLKHGEGIQYFKNGDVYKGLYLNGKPDGEGYYTWSDKSNFKGKFQNGKRNGAGVWKSPLGDQYIGTYLNDTKHGEGQFYWKSGNVYKGNFVGDKRQGYGEMYWKDGSYYKGLWNRGVQHGKGTLFLPPDKIYEGIFENNVLTIQEPKARPMTDKVFKRQRIQMMSAARPSDKSIHQNFFYQSLRKKKKKLPSPEPHYMNPHHRNCPACYQKYKQQASQRIRIHQVPKSRKKSESHYIPKPYPHLHPHQSYIHTHNHSLRQSPEYFRSFQIGEPPRVPSRLELSTAYPGGTIDTQQNNMKDKSPWRYLKFKFT